MLPWLFAVVFILVISILLRKKDPRLPPGRYGWPFIGTLPLFQVPTPEKVEEYRKMFGDIFMWRIGVQKNIFLCNPKIIREALKSPHLTKRPEHFLTFDSFTDYAKIGLFLSNGQNWEIHKKFVLRHLKEAGFGKSSFEPTIHREVGILIKQFREHFAKGPAKCPLSIHMASISVIWKLATGIEFKEGDEMLYKLAEALTPHAVLLQSNLMYFDYYPWFLPLTPNFVLDKLGLKPLKRIHQIIKDYAQSVIDQKKASLDEENPEGLIQHYLMEMKKAENIYFDERTLRIILAELILAGGDDVTSQLRWGLHIIACNPEAQRKIQKEIDSVVPRDRLPSLADKPNLPYTEGAVYEIMRVGTLAPLGVFHEASQDLMVDHYLIPKGSFILPFIQKCHTDPKYWKRANEFYPEHFLDSDGKFASNNEAFMPFSTGRRSCIGENLAKVELFLFISGLLQRFWFSAADGNALSAEKSSESAIFNIPPTMDLIVKERE